MNFRFTVVETSLNRAEFRWKWLRFLQHSFTLGVALCLLILAFAGAVALGWVTSKSPATAFFALLAFIVALIATGLVYQLYSPWHRLLLAEQAKVTEPARPEKPLDLALPATNNVEQNQSWGEVRITDPGSDLKVTKVDVVPLEIEA